MQKLMYINLRNESVTFSGAPFVLCKVGGLGMADVDVQTIQGAYQQGDTTASLRRSARTISVTLHIMASSREELYRRRMELLAILSAERAFDGENRARLVYQNDAGIYETYAIPDGGLDAGSRIGDNQPNLKLTFRCESPYWYATADSEAVFAMTGEGFALPFSFPIRFGRRDYSQELVNSGQVAAPVRVTIVGRGETPTLTNRTTGKALALESPLPVGSVLRLNTDPAALDATVTDASGSVTSAFGLLSIDTPLADFTLRAGSNELVYSAGGGAAQTEIKVMWRARYEGA